MNELEQTRDKYTRAVESFVEKIRKDPNIIAVIVCGSYAYDIVWEKSDIDMTVIIREQAIETSNYCIDEDDIILNVHLLTRTEFKRELEKSKGGSFSHSYFSKGKIVFTTDDSLYEFFEEMKKMGADDRELMFFKNSSWLLGSMHKAMKWLAVKNDLMYSQFYILKAAEAIANLEVCRNFEPPTREAILRASEINPELMDIFYKIPMSKKLTKKEVVSTIGKMEEYLEQHIELISGPVIRYMEDGEIKTVTMLSRYFKLEPHASIDVFEFLSEKGVIEKVSQTIRITPKSRKAVEEAAFVYIP